MTEVTTSSPESAAITPAEAPTHKRSVRMWQAIFVLILLGFVAPVSYTHLDVYKQQLLRGAYNYQWASKDPGSFAHNGQYIIQTLYDSIEDMGGDVSAMTRP